MVPPVETALVLGKFLPFHRGHDALIRWTRSWADKVVVLVGALAGEPIPGPVRWEWLSRHYLEDSDIRVEYTDAELPTALQPDPSVSRVWGNYLKKRFPEVTCISASEYYAPMVAEAMGDRISPLRSRSSKCGHIRNSDPAGSVEVLGLPA